MRVLASGTEWITERPGGLSRYFSDYLKAWNENGETVQALVRTSGNHNTTTLPDYVRAIPCTQTNPLKVRKLWRDVITHELSSQHYDIWNPHFAYYAWGAVDQKATEHIPIVTHFHGPWAYESKVEERGVLSQLRFQLQKYIEQRVYRFSDQFIVLSEAFADLLSNDYGIPRQQIHVIPGAVDVKRFVPTEDVEIVRHTLGLPMNRPVVVSVRRLAHRMGLDRMIQAISMLVGDFPNLLVVIVGGGKLEAQLRDLVLQLKLQDNIWFTGRVSEERLPMFYQAANLSLVPSVALEGFGLITTESLACGTPSLGTPIGGTKEVLLGFDERLLVSGSQVHDLKEALGRALGELHQLPTKQQCRDYVLQNYTWDVVAPQIATVFSAATGYSKKPEHRTLGITERVDSLCPKSIPRVE